MLLIDLRWKAVDWLWISFFVRCFTKCWTRAPPLKLVKLVLVPIMQQATSRAITTVWNVSSKWWDTQLLLIHMGDYSISSFCVLNRFSCMSHRLFQVRFGMLWPWKYAYYVSHWRSKKKTDYISEYTKCNDQKYSEIHFPAIFFYICNL